MEVFMYIRKLSLIMMVFASLFMSSCAYNGAGQGGGPSKADMGAIIGGIAGALLMDDVGKGDGNKAAMVAGALLGMFVGHELGVTMDAVDKQSHYNTMQNTMETSRAGTTSQWRNPDSGNSGSVTPVNTVYKPRGDICREFEQSIVIDGQLEKAKGIACRDADGTWRIKQ